MWLTEAMWNVMSVMFTHTWHINNSDSFSLDLAWKLPWLTGPLSYVQRPVWTIYYLLDLRFVIVCGYLISIIGEWLTLALQ